MASLAYSVARFKRPGLVTAIGVISIVVGSLGVIASLYSTGSLLMFRMAVLYGAMTMPVPVAVPAATGGAPTTAPMALSSSAAAPASPRGLDAATRAQVAQALAELRFLSGPRLEQLDALLAAAGRDVFPITPGHTLTADYAAALVENHTTGLSGDPSVPGPDTFRTKAGRFELHDDRATFFPNRAPIVRVSTLTTSNPGLTAAQVETVIRQAQATAGNTLNPSQVAALRTLLSAPGQQFVSPITVPTAIRSANSRDDGTAVLTFPNGYASIGPQGQTTSASGPGAAGAAVATLAGGRGSINGAAMGLATFAVVVGFGLAVYLFVIGIMTLNNSRHARRLHLIYAWLEIPIAVLVLAGTWWLTMSYLNGASTATPAAAMAGRASTGAAVVGGLALIYPIALLIVLQTRTLKNYFAN